MPNVSEVPVGAEHSGQRLEEAQQELGGAQRQS